MRRVSTYHTPIEFDEIWHETPYRRKKIMDLAEQYPKARWVTIAERGGPSVPIRPRIGEVVWLMSRRCRNPTPAKLIVHPDLEPKPSE